VTHCNFMIYIFYCMLGLLARIKSRTDESGTVLIRGVANLLASL